jgi:hypothetical protein
MRNKLVLLGALVAALGLAGARPATIAIDPGRALHPVDAALGPRGEIFVLAAEGAGGPLAIYRSDSLATAWTHWVGLPFAADGPSALAITPHAALVAASGGATIRIASIPLDAPEARLSEIVTPAPVLDLCADASPTLPDSNACAHLAYLLAALDSTGTHLVYRRTTDDGASWSEPKTMAQDSVAMPALFAHSEHPEVIDLCYARGDFVRWRGGSHFGTRWGTEVFVRLRATGGSGARIARQGRPAFLLIETVTHQVAGAATLNGGANWDAAIALARGSDRARVPALDWGGGRFWAAFAQGDSLLLARWSTEPSLPTNWSRPIEIARGHGLGAPAVVALADSAAVVVYAGSEGKAYSVRVR